MFFTFILVKISIARKYALLETIQLLSETFFDIPKNKQDISSNILTQDTRYKITITKVTMIPNINTSYRIYNFF